MYPPTNNSAVSDPCQKESKKEKATAKEIQTVDQATAFLNVGASSLRLKTPKSKASMAQIKRMKPTQAQAGTNSGVFTADKYKDIEKELENSP